MIQNGVVSYTDTPPDDSSTGDNYLDSWDPSRNNIGN